MSEATVKRVSYSLLKALISALCICGILVGAAPTRAPAPASPGTFTASASTGSTTVEYRGAGSVEAMQRITPSSPFAAVSCPSEWFCFYDETYFIEPRGKLSDCGWQYLSEYRWAYRIESAYYNLPKGSAKFYDSNGNYLFQVSAANRSLSNVGAHQNKATKVYRSCPR